MILHNTYEYHIGLYEYYNIGQYEYNTLTHIVIPSIAIISALLTSYY